MKLLIDADILCYNAAEITERSTCWDPEDQANLWSRTGDLSEGKLWIDSWIHDKQVDLGGDQVILCFSQKKPAPITTNHYFKEAPPPKGYFRHELWPTYKANRSKTQKPFLYPLLVKYCEEAYKTRSEPGLEADDVMGLLSEPDGTTIIVSSDKDLDTVPGYRCGMGDDDAPYLVGKEDADANLFFQTLTGDSTDNYPGCPKVGPKTAAKLLGDDPSWGKVVEIFESYMRDKPDVESYALTQARLARILRPGEYDWKTKEVKLWEPSSVTA